MAKRVPEWLTEYQKVSDKQQEYLRKIHDLRRRLQDKDEQLMMIAIQRQRLLRGRRKNPPNPGMSRTQEKAIPGGPKPFPVRHSEKGKFYMAPTIVPRKLPPLIKGKQILDGNKLPSFSTPDTDVDRQSIEIIAERNKVNLSFINPSPSPKLRIKDRKVLNMSRVSMRSDDKYFKNTFANPMEYITDISARKVVYSSGKG